MYLRMTLVLAYAAACSAYGLSPACADVIPNGDTLTAVSARNQLLGNLFKALGPANVTYWDVKTIEFDPSSSLMAVGAWIEKKARSATGQLLVSQESGVAPMVIAEEPGSLIDEISWSPAGDKLAYVAREWPPIYPDNTATSFQCIVDIKTRSRTVIAAPGVSGPKWAPDGESLLFWQATRDEKLSTLDDGRKADVWYAHAFSFLTRRTRQVSDTASYQPSVFDPDGKKFVGLGVGQSKYTVEYLEDHRRAGLTMPPDGGGWPAKWSPDPQWISFLPENGGGHGGLPDVSATAYEVTTGRTVDLDRIGDLGAKTAGQPNGHIQGGCWAPGKPHVLLMRVWSWPYPPQQLDHITSLTLLWLLYYIDTKEMQPLPSFLPKFRGDGFPPTNLDYQWSADRKYFRIAPEQIYLVSQQ